MTDSQLTCPRCRHKGMLFDFQGYIDFSRPVSMMSVFAVCPKGNHRIPLHEMLEAAWITSEEAENLLANAKIMVVHFVRESDQALRGRRDPISRAARRKLKKAKKMHGITEVN